MKKFLLAILSLGSVVYANAQCTDLFFSEIVEGSGNNKAIEIYNPTANPITLSNYRIVRYSNGSSVGVDSLTLSGTIAAHDVWVVANGQTVSAPNSPACDTALQAIADQLANVYPDPLYANGDDAILLVKASPYTVLDIFGKIGEDPGTAWSDVFPYTSAQGTWWTSDHTLIRKASVTMGVTTNPTAFNVTLEWDSLPEDTWTNLGIHNSTCSSSGVLDASKSASSVTTFPNPSNGIFTVTATSNVKGVEVYNALGELVFTNRFANSAMEQQINLSAMPEGLYLMQVELASGKRVVSKVCIR